MIKHAFSDFSYAINNESAKKGYKEILVCFIYNGVEVLKKVYIPEGDGIAYIFEAKKVIDKEMRNGSLTIYSRKFITKKKKEEAAKKKRKGVSTIAENNAPIVAPLQTPPENHTKKWVAITAAIAAVALVGAVLGTYYGVINSIPQPEPEPEPVPPSSYSVQFKGRDCNWDKKETAIPNQEYTCKIFPTGDLYLTREVIIESVVMGNQLLVEGNKNDYTFLDNNLTIKNVTDNITITASTRENTFNVYHATNSGGCECDFLSIEDHTQPAPTTAARNSQYKCFIQPKDDKYHVSNVTVLMGGKFLVENDEYTFENGELFIKNYTNANISIATTVEKNDPTEYLVYTKYVGCEEVNVPEKANVGQPYECTIKPTDSSNYNAAIASVAIGGVIVDKTNNYTETLNADGSVSLEIKADIIVGEVSITSVAVRKDQSQFKISSVSDGTCTIPAHDPVDPGTNYNCQITPVNEGDTPRVVAVIMGNRLLGEGEYSTSIGEGNVLTLTVNNVLGDLNIFAVAESQTANANTKMLAVLATGCNIDTETPNLKISPFSGDVPGAFTIEAEKTTDWVNIVSVSTGVRKLYSATDYTYKCDPDGTFNFVNGLTLVNDVVVIAQAVPATDTFFMVDHYAFGCSYTGKNTVSLNAPYTETITANDPEKYKPTIKVVMGGETLTNYEFKKKETGDEETGEWELTIAENVIKSDLAIFIMNVEKERSSFNVDCYQYLCTFNCAAYPDNKVPSGTTDYVATVTGQNNLVPSIDYIYMGNERLNLTTDYTFTTVVSVGTLKINVPITGDIVIYATAKPIDSYSVTAICEDKGGVMTATTLGDVDKSAITEVKIPNEYQSVLTNDPVPVTAVQEGLLNGCSAIQTLETPFVGIKKISADSPETDYYDHILGKMFGSAMYEGVGTLTWQDFYTEDVDPDTGLEGGYKIAKGAIPYSLNEIKFNSNDADIPNGAFSECSNIEKITYDQSSTIPEVKPYAFYECSALRFVTLPNQSLTTVGRHAFEECVMLQTVNIPKATTIEHDAFANCKGIRQIVLPNSVVNVGEQAFSGLTASNLVIIQKTRQQVRELQPSTWKTNWVADEAFVVYGCSDYTFYTDTKTNNYRFVLINNDAGNPGACISEYIGDDYAEEVTIPATVTSEIDGVEKTLKVFEVGSQVFFGFKKIKKLVFEQPTAPDTNDLEVIGNYCFTSCPAIEQIVGLKNLNKLKYIGIYAFDRLTNLGIIDPDGAKTPTSVVLPSGVKEIGKGAFAFCDSLTTVDLSNTQIEELPERMFYQSGILVKDKLTADTEFKVTLPENKIKKFGAESFAGCSRLKTLNVMPASGGDTIPVSFLDGCKSLTTVNWYPVYQDLKVISAYAFRNCSSLNSLTMNDEDGPGGEPGDKNTLPTTTDTIGDYAFENCLSFTTANGGFTIDKATSGGISNINMGAYVFNNWTSSERLYIDNGWITGGGWFSTEAYTSWGWYLSRAFADIDGDFHCSAACGSGGLIINKA